MDSVSATPQKRFIARAVSSTYLDVEPAIEQQPVRAVALTFTCPERYFVTPVNDTAASGARVNEDGISANDVVSKVEGLFEETVYFLLHQWEGVKPLVDAGEKVIFIRGDTPIESDDSRNGKFPLIRG